MPRIAVMLTRSLPSVNLGWQVARGGGALPGPEWESWGLAA